MNKECKLNSKCSTLKFTAQASQDRRISCKVYRIDDSDRLKPIGECLARQNIPA